MSHPIRFFQARLPILASLLFLSAGIASCDGQRRTPGAATHAKAAADERTPAHAAKGPGKPTVDHTLMDQGWGLPYGTVKLPAGWAFNGGVVHGDGGCFAMGDSPMWSAQSADKSYGITILPTLTTGYTSDPNLARRLQQAHCPLLQSMSAQKYLVQYILPHLHNGNLRILSTGAEPELAPIADQVRQMQVQLEQISAGSPFSRMHGTVETARVLLQYQEAGHTYNERAAAVFSCNDTLTNMPMVGRFEMLECTAPVTIVARIPDDGTPFNDAAIEAHRKDPDFFSITQNPAWIERFNQKMEAARQQQMHQSEQLRAQSQQNMRDQQARFEAGQAAHQQQMQQYDRQNQAWKDRQGKLDEAQQGFTHYLSGTNVYTNSQTGQQYELSNQYNNTYVNQNGTVSLQTDSASNPGVDWTLLQPKY